MSAERGSFFRNILNACDSRYASFVRKPPTSLLQKSSTEAFKLYLLWYHRQHPHAKRLNTFESVWQGIRQLYFDVHGVAVKDSG